jgi:hypothetical protein
VRQLTMWKPRPDGQSLDPDRALDYIWEGRDEGR